MPSFNRVTLMGNLTRDPQLKQLPSSTTVAEFGLAISRRFRTQTGDDREEVCFVDCTAFGRQADTIGQYMQKGRPILVDTRSLATVLIWSAKALLGRPPTMSRASQLCTRATLDVRGTT